METAGNQGLASKKGHERVQCGGTQKGAFCCGKSVPEAAMKKREQSGWTILTGLQEQAVVSAWDSQNPAGTQTEAPTGNT